MCVVRYDWPTTHKSHKAVRRDGRIEPKCGRKVDYDNLHFSPMTPEAVDQEERDYGLSAVMCNACFTSFRRKKKKA